MGSLVMVGGHPFRVTSMDREIFRRRTGDLLMPSPFPGVDPFIEAQGYWEEFHWKYINYAQEALIERVPDDYEVRIAERLSLVYDPDPGPSCKILPDVAVLR